MVDDVMYSTGTETWETPAYLYHIYDKIFNFTLDPAASDDNHKCARYFTEEIDGLKQSWAGEKVFMNPPYGKKIGLWVEKAFREATENGALVVCLLPSRTDTKWFQQYCLNGQIYFISGRVKFVGGKSSAPFPSMIVTFYPYRHGPGHLL